MLDHWGQKFLHSWLSCNQVTLLIMLWWVCFFSPQLNAITNINYFWYAFIFLISCNFFHFILFVQYVPGKFANEFFSRDVKSIKIEDDKKREHTPSNNWRRNGGFVLLWAKLMRNNSLQKGDICIFEIVPRNDFLLKLSVFSG